MIKKYLIPISLLLLLTACCKDDDNEPTEANQRTVMVYMAAYNNLSNYSDSDISQMEEGASGIPRNNTMVLFVDKKKDENPFIPKPGKGYDEGDYCYNQNACHFAWNRLMEWNNYGWTWVQP